MTTPRAAQEEPTSPRSEALGSNHVLKAAAEMIYRWHDDPNLDCKAEAKKIMDTSDEVHRALVALGEREAAAATPSLPVERLALWLHEDRIGCSIRCRPFSDGGGQYVACEGPNDHKWQAMTLLARLDEGSATPCSGCGGRRWTEDENWSPDYPETWKGERSHGNGLIPCGFCNEGGWNTPDFAVDEGSATPEEKR